MASPSTKISARTFTLSQRLLAGGGDTSFTVSKNSTDVFTVTSGFLWIGQGTKAEWAYFGACSVSSTSITFTSVVRGIKPDATSTSDNSSSLQYDHAIGDTVIYVQHSVDINKYLQKDADDTITGSLDFSGTSTFKLKIPRFTTVQRDALATADGIVIYNTTAGELQYCSGGSWYTLSAGSTQPLATEVVYGRVKLNEAATDPAQPTVPGINSTRILDSTSASATGQIKIASGTTGSRSATLSLHGDDTYTSGGIILARGNTGVNATSTLTHRGTGKHSVVHSESADYEIDAGTGILEHSTDWSRKYTAGETLVAGNWVYMKASDGKVYKADYTTIEKATIVGVCRTGASADATVYVQQSGIYTTTGLTANTIYYVSNTAGAYTSTTPTMVSSSVIPQQVGIALSTTQLLIRPKRLPRRVMFYGQRTQVEGNGAETITCGFTIDRAEVYASPGSSSSVEYSSMGYYDGVANATFGWAGTTHVISTADWVAVSTISSNNLVLTFTKSGATFDCNYCGAVYELI